MVKYTFETIIPTAYKLLACSSPSDLITTRNSHIRDIQLLLATPSTEVVSNTLSSQ